jgi:hypothetical protein
MSRILRGEADAVDEQVGSVCKRRRQLSLVAAFEGHEPGPGRCDFVRKPRRITSCEIDLPPGRQETTRRGAADRTGAAEDERATHDR